MPDLKAAVLRFLASPGVSALFAPLTRGRAVVLMLHRFRVPDLGVAGHDPDELRLALAALRRRGHALLPLDELLRRLRGEGAPLARAVAFTLDDGYFDQAAVAAPVFAEADCPVTTFLATGFLDGALWMWWDRLRHLLASTRVRELRATLDGVECVYRLEGQGAAGRAEADLAARLKRAPEDERLAALERLAAAAEVDVPERPPAAFAPMSWQQARACERGGMRFGPHTVTHPILARVGAEQLRREIGDSWRRLSDEVREPVPIFCYPNGTAADFGPREMDALAASGFQAALSSEPGYAALRADGVARARFALPRFSYPDSLPTLVRYVSGLERALQIARRES